jgi:arylsulfatase
MEWMQHCQSRGEPFLCYLPTNAPHAPHIELDEFVAPYRNKGPAGFFGMIAHIDKRFGDLEKFLIEHKLRDNTIVIFMTDNGGTSGVNVFNAGLRAGKTTYYDGGHRVPCWIRWPDGKLGDPRDIPVPTQNTDLFPTLCELCSVPAPAVDKADEPFRGASLAGLLQGTQKELADRKFVVQYGQIIEKFACCVIWGKWRLVKGTELYDIEADRGQKTNLAEQKPDVVQALRDYYETWWKAVEPRLNEFVPQSIGASQQPVVELTSGDWEGIYADNTGYIREAVGGPTGGHWHIKVETPGEYEFTLRRWPERTQAALGDKYATSPASPANKQNLQIVGFPTIARAKIDIAGVQADHVAVPTETAATIRVKLPAGTTKLKAWFTDADGKDLCGAFFVTVRKVP